MEVVRCYPESCEQRSEVRRSELALKGHSDCCAEKTPGGFRVEMGRLVTAIRTRDDEDPDPGVVLWAIEKGEDYGPVVNLEPAG